MSLQLISDWTKDSFEYCQDAAQRSILFMDTVRKRGDIYLDHLAEGQPPVLAFEYETILDGRTFDRPVNYSLVHILDRRYEPVSDRRHPASPPPPETKNRRRAAADQRHHSTIAEEAPEAVKRPIVIIDPRAGHGPGIGGSKKDSQIGLAMDAGHPVYFVIFSLRPVPGQTLADVRNAQIRFVEEVRRRHPNASRPAVIGNCQGGWAAALVGAERPDLVGPMVFNGSPLSYWGGVVGVNPMRYLGGLLGGTWMSSLWSDLGNGYYDGAHLVANFEILNPANTFWTKQYHVYANVDTEPPRYLNFEKWWGGFFLLGDKEIHQIVEGLFIGNKLERGEFEIEEGRYVDLKNNNNPVVLFASFGDNITPPQQAFNWILKTYGSSEEIKRRGQAIVYIGHSQIGHLGIFVSAKIARKEHKQIIASFDMLDYLPPGLYEMQIVTSPKKSVEYEVRYVEKKMQDLLTLEDPPEDEDAFLAVREISEVIDLFYRTTLSPWIRLANNDIIAEAIRQLHPMRMQRYMFSSLNPWMIPTNALATFIGRNGRRQPVAEDNPLLRQEKELSEIIVNGLNLWRDARDALWELTFMTIYESPAMKMLAAFAGLSAPRSEQWLEELRRRDTNRWLKSMEEGEFADAVVRIFILIMFAGGAVSKRGYRIIKRIFVTNQQMRKLSPENLQLIVREQSRIVQTDADRAIATLPRLLPLKKERKEALAMIDAAAKAMNRRLDTWEHAVLERVQSVLLT